MIRTLIVEDDALVARSMGRVLSRHVDVVDAVADAESALRRIELDGVDVVVTDHDLGPGMTGLELAARIRASWPEVRVIVVSGSFDPAHPPPAIGDAIDAWFAKPAPLPQLIAAILRKV